MARSTNAPASRRRRRRRLEQARGFRGGRSKRFRQATEAVSRAMRMATEHRAHRKRDYRRLWIVRINAAGRENGITYSRLIEGLTKSGIEVNRKVLADIAVHDPEGFKVLVARAREASS